jgi:hypothetical protein
MALTIRTPAPAALKTVIDPKNLHFGLTRTERFRIPQSSQKR